MNLWPQQIQDFKWRLRKLCQWVKSINFSLNQSVTRQIKVWSKSLKTCCSCLPLLTAWIPSDKLPTSSDEAAPALPLWPRRATAGGWRTCPYAPCGRTCISPEPEERHLQTRPLKEKKCTQTNMAVSHSTNLSHRKIHSSKKLPELKAIHQLIRLKRDDENIQ